MSNPENPLPAMPDVAGTWTERGGVFWLDDHGLNVRELAASMNAAGARFVTITAYQMPKNEGFRLEYHWDIAGRLLGIGFNLTGDSIESIYDLCEAVDWIEREIHEGFGIHFSGREYEPLQLRPGATIGVNLREISPAGKEFMQ
jgi:NADH:ubiquinone oxidoreductase subunit C